MKFLLKLLGVLVALVVVVYFGVVIATGYVIENQLAKLNFYPSLALQIKEKGLRKPGKPRFIFI